MAPRSPANAVRLASRAEVPICLFLNRFGWFLARITSPEPKISNPSPLSQGPVLKSDYFKECKVVLLCSTSIVSLDGLKSCAMAWIIIYPGIVLWFTRWFLHCFHLCGKSSNSETEYLLLPWVGHLVTCRYFWSRHISRISLVFQPWFTLPARYHISNGLIICYAGYAFWSLFHLRSKKKETIS